jgi:A/G-specific adenine glycosylase
VVLAWYRRGGRDLAWRRTRDPYAILVSEVMLQQTQVARVVPAYRRFLTRFPTLRSLARASLGDVLRLWSGLGYNRRARDLHRVARAHKGRLPRDVAGLDALPGVGPYTAAAVACFAYGEATAFAETNIRRVLGRALIGRTATSAEARELDERLMSRRTPAPWHHALMDIGATFCVALRPRCQACPLARACVFRASGMHAEPPARRQGPFATSDRRVRGRIVGLLTTSAEGMTVAALRRAVGDSRVARLVSALADEGLVMRAGRRVLLPD